MRKTAVAAVALASATALTGASVSSTAAPSSDTKALHVFKWHLKETASHDIGQRSFTGTDVIRSAASRKVLGYDTITGRVYPKKQKVTVQAAFAVKDGILLGRLTATFDQSSPEVTVFRGPILGGSGKFKGASGTLIARSPASDDSKTFVTVRVRY